MSFLKKHRTILLALAGATIVFSLLLVLSLWNPLVKNHIKTSAWPLIFLIFSISCFLASVIVFRRGFNANVIEEIIRQNVEQERTRLLAEFEKQDEEVINKEDNLADIVSRIIPKGRFKSKASFADKLLQNLSSELQVSIGVLYLGEGKNFSYLAGFALPGKNPPDFQSGENLTGQVAESKELLKVENIPEEYFSIESGLGKSKPNSVLIAPLLHKNAVIAILEIATFIEGDDKLVQIISEVAAQTAEKLMQIEKS